MIATFRLAHQIKRTRDADQITRVIAARLQRVFRFVELEHATIIAVS
jgi:hypothetical protein